MSLKPFNSIGGFAVGEGQDIVIDSNLNATLANIDASGNLVVSGFANIVGDIFAADAEFGNLLINTDANIVGDLVIGNSISVTSNISAGNIAVTGEFTGSSITVSGQAQSATINVTDSGNVANFLGIGNALFVTNGVTSGSLDTGEIVSSGSANIAVDVIVGNDLSVSGDANIIGGANVGGILDVTGDASIDGVLTVSNVANITSDLIVGGDANVSGDLLVLATSNVVGAATFGSTINVANVATVNGLVVSTDALISGNLTVDGNVVYVNVENLTVEDPLIDLGTGANGAALTANDGKDRGTLLEYFSTAGNVALTAYSGWKNSAGEFYMASEVTVANDIVTVNDWGNVRLDTVLGNVVGGYITLTGAANISGPLTVSNIANITSDLFVGGNANISGNLNIGGDVQFDDLYSTGNLVAAKAVIGNTVSANANMTFGTTLTGPAVFANSLVSNAVILANSTIGYSSNTTARSAFTSSNVAQVIFSGTSSQNYSFRLVGIDQGNIANRYAVSIDSDSSGDYVIYNTLGSSLGSLSFAIDAPNNLANLSVTPNTNNSIVWYNTVTTTNF
jgi:cytoskeletal protein CcmA (bactofilin family)